jgi:two-component sensor histidine kinase
MNQLVEGVIDPTGTDAKLHTQAMAGKRPEQLIQELAASVATCVKAAAAVAEVETSLAPAEANIAADAATAIAESVIAAAQGAAAAVESAAAAAAAALAVQAAAAAFTASAIDETAASSAQAAAVEAEAATIAAAVAVKTAVRAAALAVALAERTAVEAAGALATEKALTQALQSALNEKRVLLMEVHHRVKNNLQVITSLLRLESRRSILDDTKTVLADMQARIRVMALLHELLYRSDTLASVDLGIYLGQLSTQVFRMRSTKLTDIGLELRLGSVQVSMDQAIPCGLLVNELISNCLKHGFPLGRNGAVSIDLQPLETPKLWRLRVGDTGVGLPQDFEERRQNSLGLQLATDLARQIGGSLHIANEGKGVAFTVDFTTLAPVPLVMPG